ncbi:hypothetical protein HPB50_009359 [Hyalomma asiaticum]|uniref:Uncharacterized protein n=1 Tax=Hyalomma asiaticum TaxID=266040 RepID=A0ACB7TLB8_HYAAI|nr:hypothetical protein HPB50_009359 [Hyalomma asiaticum]
MAGSSDDGICASAGSIPAPSAGIGKNIAASTSVECSRTWRQRIRPRLSRSSQKAAEDLRALPTYRHRNTLPSHQRLRRGVMGGCCGPGEGHHVRWTHNSRRLESDFAVQSCGDVQEIETTSGACAGNFDVETGEAERRGRPDAPFGKPAGAAYVEHLMRGASRKRQCEDVLVSDNARCVNVSAVLQPEEGSSRNNHCDARAAGQKARAEPVSQDSRLRLYWLAGFTAVVAPNGRC